MSKLLWLSENSIHQNVCRSSHRYRLALKQQTNTKKYNKRQLLLQLKEMFLLADKSIHTSSI